MFKHIYEDKLEFTVIIKRNTNAMWQSTKLPIITSGDT